MDKDPDVAARLNVLRMRVLADAESQKYLKGKEPTDAELHAEYDTAVAAMDKTEYHARHILVATKEKAEAAHQEDQGRRQVRGRGQGRIDRRFQDQRRRSRLVHASRAWPSRSPMR